MKNKFLQITLIASLLLGCTKENLNDCDPASPVFKTIKADFTPVINNNIVTFKNNSINAETYSWDFGDGTTSTVFEPNKQFVYRDTPYTIKLTGSRCGGEKVSTISKNILIKCIPAAVTSLPGGISLRRHFYGEINFNIPQITDKSVEEYGFIYKPFFTDSDFSIGDKDVIKIALSQKPEGNIYKFNYDFVPNAKNFTYRAYIKDCNGINYGSRVKL